MINKEVRDEILILGFYGFAFYGLISFSWSVIKFLLDILEG